MRKKLLTLGKTRAFHLVVRARYPLTPFLNRAVCVATWRRLQGAFPLCLGAVLMPNHLHIIVEGEDPSRLRNRLARICPGPRWQPVPEPEEIPDERHLQRLVRYVHLNPSRKTPGLDPLAWEWSTHRDCMGAVARPWVELKGSGEIGAMRCSFHKYISSDPTVLVQGTPPPQIPLKPQLLDLDGVERAAAAITRSNAGSFRRKGRLRAELMEVLVTGFGVPLREVARHFNVHPSSVRTGPEHRPSPHPWFASLTLTLSDHRLCPRPQAKNRLLPMGGNRGAERLSRHF